MKVILDAVGTKHEDDYKELMAGKKPEPQTLVLEHAVSFIEPTIILTLGKETIIIDAWQLWNAVNALT